jgi:hypothetical protein
MAATIFPTGSAAAGSPINPRASAALARINSEGSFNAAISASRPLLSPINPIANAAICRTSGSGSFIASTSGMTPAASPTRPTANAARRRIRASASVSNRSKSADALSESRSTRVSSSFRIHDIFCSNADRVGTAAAGAAGGAAGALAHDAAPTVTSAICKTGSTRRRQGADGTSAMISSAPPCSSVTSPSKGRSVRAKLH